MEYREKKLYDFLVNCMQIDNKPTLNEKINIFIKLVSSWKKDNADPDNITNNNRITVWERNLTQIRESISLDRARYYINRMMKSLTLKNLGKVNDIDFGNWKEYEDILTDSLWLFEKRDRTLSHNASYWGNFIPQIPNQLIRRFTKKGETVLDPFLGSGTTAIESLRLQRNCIGVDISQDQIAHSRELTESIDRKSVFLELVRGNSAEVDFKRVLSEHDLQYVQLAILHPPYWDIIRFNEEEGNLSGAPSIEEFRSMFSKVLTNVLRVLEKGRFLAIVIGDSYRKGEWIPIGFYLMDDAMKMGLKLKSIVVKNYSDTKAKRQSTQLWRYRALKGNFYVFKHEYIFIFRKP